MRTLAISHALALSGMLDSQVNAPLIPVCVIGTSAGGPQALSTLLSLLDVDIPLAVCVVMHTGACSVLDQVLRKHTRNPVKFAEDGEALVMSTVYLARPGRHLLIGLADLRLGAERSDRWIPSVDSLFKSAAQTHRKRTIAVVLTGCLNDGTQGLKTVKELGGIAIVQDPAEASFPEMPKNALAGTQADYCVPLARIGCLVNQIARDWNIQQSCSSRS